MEKRGQIAPPSVPLDLCTTHTLKKTSMICAGPLVQNCVRRASGQPGGFVTVGLEKRLEFASLRRAHTKKKRKKKKRKKEKDQTTTVTNEEDIGFNAFKVGIASYLGRSCPQELLNKPNTTNDPY